ncbi:hypothetical protein IGI04_013455 [Brassica rapa subsp. trilocularis]|uniref:Ubiquitin-like protease family profile domain-containing protein n=1 Tax=Brassica rapa subsp. trilocularis TaxID=1813537 RepID=A0ABQ7NAU9_BRACM|nr:hypothetical protein IGI04_013455 [Brassica rapa subsp. trilocularis]
MFLSFWLRHVINSVKESATPVLPFKTSRLISKLTRSPFGVSAVPRKIFVLPHPLIKHWIFVLRNDQTHSPIFRFVQIQPLLGSAIEFKNKYSGTCFRRTSAGCLGTRYNRWEAYQNQLGLCPSAQPEADYQPLSSQLSICSGASVTKVNNGTQLNLLAMVNAQIHLSEMKPGRSKQNVKKGGKLIGLTWCMLQKSVKASFSPLYATLTSLFISSSHTRTFKLFINAKKQNIIIKQKNINL